MIQYSNDAWLMILVCRCRGSVLPKAGLYATTNCILAIILHWSVRRYSDFAYADDDGDGVADFLEQMEGAPIMWSGYTAVLSVMMVFRNNQAFSRFWEGATLVRQLRGEWFNSVNALFSFCSRDRSKGGKVHEFQQLLVRLSSVLFCSALQQICDLDEEALEVLDLSDISVGQLKFLEEVPDRTYIIAGWIQRLILKSHSEGILDVPSPILSRSFQELSRGAVNLNNLRKIKEIPFPFPYQQMLICMLLVHYIMTPVLASFFVTNMFVASSLCFFVTGGFWGIQYIAAEIDEPFGNDANDLPLIEMQKEFNEALLMLLLPQAQAVPSLNRRSSSKKKRITLKSKKSESVVAYRINAHRGSNNEDLQCPETPFQRNRMVSFNGDAHKSEVSEALHNQNQKSEGGYSSEDEKNLKLPVDEKPKKAKKREDSAAFDTGSTVDTTRSGDDDTGQRRLSSKMSFPMALKLAGLFRKVEENGNDSDCSSSDGSSCTSRSEPSYTESEPDTGSGTASGTSRPDGKESIRGASCSGGLATNSAALGLNAMQTGHQSELKSTSSLERHEHVRV